MAASKNRGATGAYAASAGGMSGSGGSKGLGIGRGLGAGIGASLSGSGYPGSSHRGMGRQTGLSQGEKVRLVMMVAGTILLVLMMLLLLSGNLDNVLSSFLGEPETGEPGSEGVAETQTVGAGPGDGGAEPELIPVPIRPGGVGGDGEGDSERSGLAGELESSGFTIVPDPGDDESWRYTESYKRYREYIAKLDSMTDEDLAAAVDPDVRVFSHVWLDPEDYRGEVIRLRGVLVRRKEKVDKPEDLPPGVDVKWEVQIYNYGSKHIYTLDLIGDCPESLLNKPVAIDAIFFDVYDYMARRNVRRYSCFFIGRSLKAYELRQPSSAYLLWILGIPIVLVLSFALFEARKLSRFEERYLDGRSRKQYERKQRMQAKRAALQGGGEEGVADSDSAGEQDAAEAGGGENSEA